MAASDQTYRNQKTLDTVFGVSCVLMLVGIIYMFADDYNREWKKDQRAFRDVETLMAERAALNKMPNARDLMAAETALHELDLNAAIADVNDLERKVAEEQDNGEKKVLRAKLKIARQKRDGLQADQDELDEIKKQLDDRRLQADLVKSDNRARTIKADLDSKKSLYDIEVDKTGPDFDRSKRLHEEVERLEMEWVSAQADADSKKKEKEELLYKQDRIERPKKDAEARLKKLLGDFDLQAKLVESKKWGRGDWFRALPVLDALNSPLKISQYTLNDLPIDYNFKYVTRFDRCTTCHLGIDRPGYDKKALRDLRNGSLGLRLRESDLNIVKAKADVKKAMRNKKDFSKEAKQLNREEAYKDRLKELAESLGQNTLDLKESQVNEFCAHPRLDLFVGAGSAHSAEKFGCTTCHGGQGSATSFFYASHTPNDAVIKDEWAKSGGDNGHDWKANHDWEFPMQPMRFVESQCLKCHHQVTDLIREGNRNEAPKLTRGYNLVRELGCFGCHEIPGTKGGRSIGPDLRLEPIPALADLSPEERMRAMADPQSLPGTMRKVGPSLYRLSEKTRPGWVKRWIKSPRSFRPTTRMPHFYGLSTNNENVLPGDQKQFPDAEIEAITYYLFRESRDYIGNVDTERRQDYLKLLDTFRSAQRKAKNKKLESLKKLEAELEATEADRDALSRLLSQSAPREADAEKSWAKKIRTLEGKLGLVAKADDLLKDTILSEQQKKDLSEATHRLDQRAELETLAVKFARSAAGVKAKDPVEQIKDGRRLFSEKGCLACHSHKAVSRPEKGLVPDLTDSQKAGKEGELPAIDRDIYFKGQPTFGPNLSMLVEKLGTDEEGKDRESKRQWLIQWILDPHFHSPRTLMPVTHLTFEEASAVAAWLLNQKAEEMGEDWADVKVKEANTRLDTLKKLANLTLGKSLASDELANLYKGKLAEATTRSLAADDRELAQAIEADSKRADEAVKWYVGKKAIGRLGCFGCHNIPGFDRAKPIGTPLNDWGKKDPERLAFEDIKAYLEDHYEVADRLQDDKGNPVRLKKSKGSWVTAKEGKSGYYEKFFAEALEHHSREGFLHQKLRAPRSYDYNRVRPWDERLRMPQFKLARTRRREKESADDFAYRMGMSTDWKVVEPHPRESDAQLQARAELEEAEAREAVMTFVLGLVAEPIPMKLVNDPPPDRRAEARGRQVLDKYNCAGCHLVREGTYDFKVTDEVVNGFDDFPNQSDFADDHVFASHNAWKGPATSGDKLTIHGVPRLTFDTENNRKQVTLRVMEALSYTSTKNEKKEVKEIRAFGQVPVIRHEMTIEAEPLGGHFADLLTPYFIKVYKAEKQFEAEDKNLDPDHQDNQYARAAGPPSLLREGEKVQPNWLFQFLKNPSKIRPMARLRMPRFNMSDEEAHALVNYFAAVAKVDNPGIGLTYPYVNIPQKDDDFLARRNRDYLAKLKGDKKEYDLRLKEMAAVWKEDLDHQVVVEQRALAAAETAIKQLEKAAKSEDDEDKKKAIEDDLKTAKENRDKIKEGVGRLKDRVEKKDFKTQEKSWEADEAFVIDGFKLLTNKDLCLNCHQIGRLPAGQALGGPSLDLTQDRLRPDWTMRWIANPQRFLTYKSIMPMNFPKSQPITPEAQALFVGSQIERVIAARDILMNFRKADAMVGDKMPSQTPPPGGGK